MLPSPFPRLRERRCVAGLSKDPVLTLSDASAVSGVSAVSACRPACFYAYCYIGAKVTEAALSEAASRGQLKLTSRCRGGGSNPYALLGPRILSPLRLPFRHPGWCGEVYD